MWLDEPLSDVDDASVGRIVSLLETYAAVGGGVVVSTHRLDAFEDVCTHLTVFLDGQASRTVPVADRNRPLQVLYRDLVEDLSP